MKKKVNKKTELTFEWFVKNGYLKVGEEGEVITTVEFNRVIEYAVPLTQKNVVIDGKNITLHRLLTDDDLRQGINRPRDNKSIYYKPHKKVLVDKRLAVNKIKK